MPSTFFNSRAFDIPQSRAERIARIDALATLLDTAFLIPGTNIRFGLEMRRLPMGDGGLAIHVLADIGGTPGKAYTEETELLAFDHFWNGAHYHYGPRNKNHRIYWDRTLVEDPLAWTLDQFETGKLRAMIERAGYPGIAADLDMEKIASVFPAMKKQALEMWAEGERVTGHPGLPLEPTPNGSRRDAG